MKSYFRQLLLLIVGCGVAGGQNSSEASANEWLLKIGEKFQSIPDCVLTYTIRDYLNGAKRTDSENRYTKKGTKWKFDQYVDHELFRCVSFDGEKYQDFSLKLDQITSGSKLSQMPRSAWIVLNMCPLYLPYAGLFEDETGNLFFDPGSVGVQTEWLKLSTLWEVKPLEIGSTLMENKTRRVSYYFSKDFSTLTRHTAQMKEFNTDFIFETKHLDFHDYKCGDIVLKLPKLIQTTINTQSGNAPGRIVSEVILTDAALNLIDGRVSDEDFSIPRSIAKRLFDVELKSFVK